jgi:hypothetical protein
MTMKYLATALAVTTGLLFSVSTVHAKRPLDVDCDVLASAIVCTGDILEANNVVFNSVGQLFSFAILDDAVFEVLQSVFLLCSGGAIDFNSSSQAISTVASCGLLRQLQDEISD